MSSLAAVQKTRETCAFTSVAEGPVLAAIMLTLHKNLESSSRRGLNAQSISTNVRNVTCPSGSSRHLIGERTLALPTLDCPDFDCWAPVERGRASYPNNWTRAVVRAVPRS